MVTLKHAARLVNRPYTTLHGLAHQGTLPAIRSGATWLVDLKEVQYALSALKVQKRRAYDRRKKHA